jgi:hypothetical protein
MKTHLRVDGSDQEKPPWQTDGQLWAGTGGENRTGLRRQSSMRYMMRARYMTASGYVWKRRAVAGPKHQVEGKEACMSTARSHGWPLPG